MSDFSSAFSTEMTVLETSCDFKGEMMAGDYLRALQEVGRLHCCSIGLNAEVYEQTSSTFLMVKLCLEIFQPICAGDELKIITHASPPRHAVYVRYAEFFVGDTLAAAITTRWVLVERKTHTILKKIPDNFPMPFSSENLPQVGRNEKSTELLPCGTVLATYSRCDCNMHINNAKYADIACDCLPFEVFKSSSLRKLLISYHNELPALESMELFIGKTDNGYYICAEQDKKSIFECNIDI